MSASDKKPEFRRPKVEDNIWTKFCFLDESGSLNDVQSPFFTVGFLKINSPSYLMGVINKQRRRKGFYDEMRFNKLSRLNIEFAKFAIDAMFQSRGVSFSSYTLDKSGEYFDKVYGGDPWRAYEAITVKLVRSTASPNEVLMILADHVDTPGYVHFESSVQRLVNMAAKEIIVAGIVRLDSKCNDLLQLADLVIGCINYDLKLQTSVTESVSHSKAELLNHLKANLGATDFLSGFRNYNFNVFVDQDIKLRTEKASKSVIDAGEMEKGPSS